MLSFFGCWSVLSSADHIVAPSQRLVNAADQIRPDAQAGRATRSVLAGSKRPVRASAHRTRQAPRVASSQ